jgi:DDE superfamily endonuclease
VQQIVASSDVEKNELKPHLNKYWCIPPKQSAEFVACMEDVLDVYTRPYDPLRPLVCLDETSKQLITETRPSQPCKPGRVKRVDPEYRRNGTASVFMMTTPLEGQRHVRVREHRKREDFAGVIRELCDKRYPDAERIVPVMDQLNRHNTASLYQAFEPAEAKRLADKLEIHHTPKHGSWLNMAEIELSVLSRQCLSDYFETREQLSKQIVAWERPRNESKAGIDWRFTTDQARIKLKRLYPSI